MEEKYSKIKENQRIWFETEGKKIIEEIERQIFFKKGKKLGSKDRVKQRFQQ